MSKPAAQPDIVTELKASAHLMRLDPGLYCVYHSEGSQRPDPATGLPGARLTLPPGPANHGVVISGFGDDGWISFDSASLIRVSAGPARVLMTVYQAPGSGHEPPRMQVRRLIEGVSETAQPATPQQPPPTNGAPPTNEATVTGGSMGTAAPEPEIAAHVQLSGDVLARIGEWVGEPGSQRWIEGFAVAPRHQVEIGDIEYQAVLGRGWLSPWAEGGQYCGSRGMALPILGLRARLRGAAAATHVLQVSATFTDGAKVGPVGGGEPCEADSLAPLEAFQLIVRPADPATDQGPRARQPKPGKGVSEPALPRTLQPAAKPGPKRTKAAASAPSEPVPQQTPTKAGRPKTGKAAPSKPVPTVKGRGRRT